MKYNFVERLGSTVILQNAEEWVYQNGSWIANPERGSNVTVAADEYDRYFYECNCCCHRYDSRDDEKHSIRGDTLCPECFDENTAYCSCCEELNYQEDMIWCDQTDEYFCQSCADENLRWCYGHDRYEVEDDDHYFYEVDGDLYCEDYCSRHFHWCAGHEEYEDDEDVFCVDDEYYCGEYCDDHFFWCAGHDQYENPQFTDRFEINGEYYCEEYCENAEEFVYCDNCDSYIDVEESVLNGEGEVVCQDCLYGYEHSSNRISRRENPLRSSFTTHNRSIIMGYHNHPNSEKARMLDTVPRKMEPHLGVELEVWSPNGVRSGDAEAVADVLGDYAVFETDGSLCSRGGNGFEIITRPGTIETHLSERWGKTEEAISVLLSKGYNSHTSNVCGLHVHIDRGYFGSPSSKTTQDLANAKFLFIFSRHWENLVRFSRRDKFTYCHKSPDTTGSVYDRDFRANVIRKITAKTIATERKDLAGHGYAVNIDNPHQPTIEIRLWRGSLRPETIRATLKFSARLAWIVKNKPIAEIDKMSFEDLLGDDEEVLSYWETVKNRKVTSKTA